MTVIVVTQIKLFLSTKKKKKPCKPIRTFFRINGALGDFGKSRAFAGRRQQAGHGVISWEQEDVDEVSSSHPGGWKLAKGSPGRETGGRCGGILGAGRSSAETGCARLGEAGTILDEPGAGLWGAKGSRHLSWEPMSAAGPIPDRDPVTGGGPRRACSCSSSTPAPPGGILPYFLFWCDTGSHSTAQAGLEPII